MKNNDFKAPLTQSAAVIGGVIVLMLIVASSGAGAAGGGVLAGIIGVGKTILFLIGLGISLAICIAILVGIFLGAVAMTSPEQARQMYADLKKNFALSVISLCSCPSCSDDGAAKAQLEEEYNQMKQEFAQLQQSNTTLLNKLDTLRKDNESLQNAVSNVENENVGLKVKLDDLHNTVSALQESEKSINEVITQLSEKLNKSNDQEIREQLTKLEKLQATTKEEIDAIQERLNSLEGSIKQSQTSGIFAYIEDEGSQYLFTESVAEAVDKGLTYAQIDDYLSETLPAALDKVIKDHPSLTKNYIRSIRRD